MKFSMIVAYDDNRSIGFENKIQWNIREDMKHFSKKTKGRGNNAIVMGRKTWESLPVKPLPGRLNVVMTRDCEAIYPKEVVIFNNFKRCILELSRNKIIDEVFIIGGSEIYNLFISSPIVTTIYVTRIHQMNNKADAFFPKADGFILSESSDVIENNPPFTFQTYKRINKEEMQYLDICKDVIDSGNCKGDRTGTGTISKFGVTMRFSLKDGKIPVLTTKKVFWKAVVLELLWMISGSTDARVLKDQGIGIWDGNSTREFTDLSGFPDREAGDLGPVYGHQWRYFGAKYIDSKTDYSGQGIDQLQRCIDLIKNEPNSRRIVMSAWNASDIELMNLAPCHCLVQFYVHDGHLSLSLYQRSGDMGLGIPFNISSYSLLLCLVAQVTNLIPGEFIHTIGDCHVYNNHVDALCTQIYREPKGFPSISINPEINSIDDFKISDIVLSNYYPESSISMKMAV